MIELSILDLLYLVLTFFVVIIGTLLTVALLRFLKILGVVTELCDYYQNIKKILAGYGQASLLIKDKVVDFFVGDEDKELQKDEK